jgi:hypothetical protein
VRALAGVALAGALLLLSGCGHSASLIKELAKDKASVCHRLTTIYGSSTFVRVGEGQTVTFDEGCGVRK